jgi:ABC-2 type transport system permease protein
MTAYGAVLSARFRTLLQYRGAALAGVATRLFWGLIRVMIFEAFYRSSPVQQPIHISEMVTYIWLGQAFLALLPAIGAVDVELRTMIRSGTVAYELLRPVDLYTLWYSRVLAGRLAPTVLQAPLVLLFAAVVFKVGPPPSFASGAAWALSTLAAILLSTAITTLVSLSLLWTLSGEGISRVIPPLSYALSGLLVPVPLCPGWVQAVLNFLPFVGLVDAPFRLYMGHLPPEAAFGVVLHQLAWSAVLVLFGRWLLGRAARRLVVQGG